MEWKGYSTMMGLHARKFDYLTTIAVGQWIKKGCEIQIISFQHTYCLFISTLCSRIAIRQKYSRSTPSILWVIYRNFFPKSKVSSMKIPTKIDSLNMYCKKITLLLLFPDFVVLKLSQHNLQACKILLVKRPKEFN